MTLLSILITTSLSFSYMATSMQRCHTEMTNTRWEVLLTNTHPATTCFWYPYFSVGGVRFYLFIYLFSRPEVRVQMRNAYGKIWRARTWPTAILHPWSLPAEIRRIERLIFVQPPQNFLRLDVTIKEMGLPYSINRMFQSHLWDMLFIEDVELFHSTLPETALPFASVHFILSQFAVASH